MGVYARWNYLSVVWASNDDERQYLMAWAGALIPHVGDAGFCGPGQVAAVIGSNGALRAVVIFHDWIEGARTLQVSAASVTPYWASPDNLREVLHYAFVTNGTRKLWMAIPHTSENVIRFNKHLGFVQEAVLRYHFSEQSHAIILSMLEDEYRKSRWAVSRKSRIEVEELN